MRALIPLMSLYEWDESILDGMYIAGDFDIKESFLLRYGEMTPIYQKPELLKLAITNVAKSLKWSIDKLYAVTQLEYNPIENYDRYEDSTDKIDDETDNTQQYGTQVVAAKNKTGDITTTPDTTTERKVSAFNESTYQPSEQETNKGSVTETHAEDSGSTTTTKQPDIQHAEYNRTAKRDSHIHGNIGVTTSQQMLMAELEVAQQNYIDTVCEMYANRLMIKIW